MDDVGSINCEANLLWETMGTTVHIILPLDDGIDKMVIVMSPIYFLKFHNYIDFDHFFNFQYQIILN
jgi:hypothetical protein